MKKVFFSKNSETSYDVLTAGKQAIGKVGELNKMENQVFIIVMNDAGTPRVRAFKSKKVALDYMKKWFNQEKENLKLFGHVLKSSEFDELSGFAIIETENQEFTFDLMQTDLKN